MKYLWLYLLVWAGLLLIVVTAMGNGLLNQPVDYQAWNYRLYTGVCHQMPERSLTINGVPMAVNARCFGVFSGLWLIWTLLPWMGVKLLSGHWPVRLLVIALLVQVIDVAASQLSVWNSSNFSRFFSGLFLGAAVVAAMGEMLKKK